MSPTNPIIFVDQGKVKQFIESYIREYRRLVEEAHSDLKDIFNTYNDYPFSVVAMITPQTTYIFYEPNAVFSVQVTNASEPPKMDMTKRSIGAFRNDYLNELIKNPEKAANEDISHEVSEYEWMERSNEEMADYAELQEAQYEDEFIEKRVLGYSSYFDTAYDVKKETFSKRRNDIYFIAQLVNSISGNLSLAFLKSKCSTLFKVHDAVTQDIESSFFLAIHGKYDAANALLRRIAETSLTALYFDYKISKLKGGTRTFQFHEKRRTNWIENPKAANLVFNGVLHELLDPDTDYIGKEALNAEIHKPISSFKAYFDHLYGDLSNYVHYGGLGLIDRFSLDFSKYNDDKINNWMYNLRRVIEVIGILLAIKFPKVLIEYDKAEAGLFQYRSQLITQKQLTIIDTELKKV